MKRGDKIVAIFIVALIIFSIIGVFAYKQYVKGSQSLAIIKQDGKIIKTINLKNIKQNTKLNIPYKDKNFNLIEISPGKIRFVDADCPDKICVKTGWISEPGQTAVCLPHKLLIEIEGKNSSYDQISN